MKYRLVFAVLIALFASFAFSAEKSSGPRIRLMVSVESIRPDSLVVSLSSYAEVTPKGDLYFVPERAQSWAVLTPGGKCAVGDKFEVWSKETGIRKVEPYGELRCYSVISAKRL